jgi:hypothetical protein
VREGRTGERDARGVDIALQGITVIPWYSMTAPDDEGVPR